MILQRRDIFLMILMSMLLLNACKKDEDITRPEITLNAPVENAIFTVGDTMNIIGRVSHNSLLSSIKIVVKDDLNTAVTVPKYLYPNSFTYQIDLNYVLDAFGLESGVYTLMITASDGSITGSIFRSIQINGVERYFQRVLALCRPSILKTYVYSIDSSLNLQNILNTPYGFTASELSSRQRKLMMIKADPSKLFVYDLDDLVEDQWLAANPPYPVFNDIYYNDYHAYVAGANGDIKGVNQLGSTVFVTPQNVDTIPYILHRHQDYLMSYCKSRSGSEQFIRQYFTPSGVFRVSLEINFSVCGFHSPDDEFCLLFGNDNGIGAIYELNVTDNYIIGLEEFPLGEIRDVCEIYTGEYIIAHTDGLFHYSWNDHSLTAWIPAFQADMMAYDDTRGLLFCGSGQTISVIRIDNGDVVEEISLPYPVYDLHIQHNI